MKAPIKLFAPVLAALFVAACNAGGNSSLPAATGQLSQLSIERLSEPYWKATGEATQVCPDAPPGYATCDVLLENKIFPMTVIGGWKPADFQAAYHLPSSSKGAGQIVAIVDAYDNPDATSDLAKYRSEFGLGKAKFAKYNQKGEKKDYPTTCATGTQGVHSWCLEDDLDIEMVSAVCPKCTVYLVEADTNNTNDLETAEAEAVKLGAHIVSNSWGCTGSNACLSTKYFDTKGVVYLASGGDSGYGTQAPAALASVVAVGGTFLTKNSTGYSETVWVDSGSGCATGVTKPAWQKDPKCTSRTMDDVSAVAQGVAEYDTAYGNGWLQVEGTSIGSPLLSGVFGLAGNADKQNAGEAFWKIKKTVIKKELHDITSGTVSRCPSSLMGTYLCEAGTKEYGQYAAPIGWGTPDGIKAF